MDNPVGAITAPELKARFDRGDGLVILDVREEDERMFAAIPLPESSTDLHISLGEVARRFEEIESAVQGHPLVVYCHHGQRSMVAATWLVRRGLTDVSNLEGGIDAWSTQVDRAVRRY